MAAFEIIVNTMVEMGFRLFLPWLLVLSVSYGLLIALALAFLAIIGVNNFAPAGIFTNFAAAITFGLFGLLGFMVLVAMAGYDLEKYSEGGFPRYVAVTIFVVSFISVVVLYVDISSIISESQNVFEDIILPILILIFFLLIVRETASS
jgi:hypothetical protein